MDAQFWSQDEVLLAKYGGSHDDPLPSIRRAWVKLDSPPIEHVFVGLAEWDGIPFALRSDGRAFAWAYAPPGPEGEQDRLPHWHPVLESAPRT
jgi:hypothetical protein